MPLAGPDAGREIQPAARALLEQGQVEETLTGSAAAVSAIRAMREQGVGVRPRAPGLLRRNHHREGVRLVQILPILSVATNTRRTIPSVVIHLYHHEDCDRS